MAGDWIKMRGNLWDDPRVAALVDATDTSEAQVIGGLYWLWATADQHTENGHLPGLTLRQIDRKTGIPGFAAALVSIGWLTEGEGGVTLANFQEHNGASAKKRAVTAKRVANHRSSNADSPTTDDSVTPPALQEPDASVTGALAREREEIEEEKREREIPSDAYASGGDAAKPAADLTKAELWAAGKSLLAEQGMPKAQCGSFVGKLVSDYGDAIVIEAVRATVVTRPADAAEYLKGCCMRATGQRGPAEPAWRTEQRERTQLAAPGVAAGRPAAEFFDVEARAVTPALGAPQ